MIKCEILNKKICYDGLMADIKVECTGDAQDIVNEYLQITKQLFKQPLIAEAILAAMPKIIEEVHND